MNIERRHVHGTFSQDLRGARDASEVHERAHGRKTRGAVVDFANDVGMVSRVLHFGLETIRSWLRTFRLRDLAPVGPAANPEQEGRMNQEQAFDEPDRYRNDAVVLPEVTWSAVQPYRSITAFSSRCMVAKRPTGEFVAMSVNDGIPKPDELIAAVPSYDSSALIWGHALGNIDGRYPIATEPALHCSLPAYVASFGRS